MDTKTRMGYVSRGEDHIYEYCEKCIICNKGSYGDYHMVKIPEMVGFCVECLGRIKSPDNSTGRVTHLVGEGPVPLDSQRDENKSE